MLVPAFFGLGGVIVGALVSGWVQWRLDRTRAAATRRSSLRLLSSDLYVAQALILPVLETGAWGPEQILLPVSAYEEYRGVLAAELVDEVVNDPDGKQITLWRCVDNAILGIRRLNDARNYSLAANRDFTEAELADFNRIGEYVDGTIEALRPFCD